jgi:ASC-1-like (ASCH) protein
MVDYERKYVKYKVKLKRLNEGNLVHKMNVQQPWFNLMKQGKKTVEGRLNRGKFKSLQIGDIIEWTNKQHTFKLKIVGIRKYKTFKEMLEKEGLNQVLPIKDNIIDGVAVYRQFYLEKDEMENGVLAIEFNKIY